MEYKKIIEDNYTLHLINNDRFKIMNVVVFFTKKYDKNDMVISEEKINVSINDIQSAHKLFKKNKFQKPC